MWGTRRDEIAHKWGTRHPAGLYVGPSALGVFWMVGTWGFAPGWYMSRLRRLAADCALAALGKRYTCGRNEERQWSVVSAQWLVVSKGKDRSGFLRCAAE